MLSFWKSTPQKMSGVMILYCFLLSNVHPVLHLAVPHLNKNGWCCVTPVWGLHFNTLRIHLQSMQVQPCHCICIRCMCKGQC